LTKPPAGSAAKQELSDRPVFLLQLIRDFPAARVLSRQTSGWISIAVWLTFGLLLEGLLGYKTPAYLLDLSARIVSPAPRS